MKWYALWYNVQGRAFCQHAKVLIGLVGEVMVIGICFWGPARRSRPQPSREATDTGALHPAGKSKPLDDDVPTENPVDACHDQG